MEPEKVSVAESLGMFNAYSVEVRSKIDGLVRQLLVLSGGVQAITIGAFLSGTPPNFPPAAAELLKIGWLALSVCIVLCLIFMLGQLIAMVIVGLKFKTKLEQMQSGTEVMVAPLALRILNCIVGLSAFASCAAGIVALSAAAMALINGPIGV